MVVPLLQCGGTRLKILEVFASVCPVIITTKGAEGLQAQNGEHLLLCDSISDIIEGVNAVWSDIHLSQNLTLSAYNLVKTTCLARLVDAMQWTSGCNLICCGY